MSDTQQAIEGEVVQLITSEGRLTTELTQLESELQQDPKFQAFLEKQKELREAQTKIANSWKQIESKMIEHSIKSIKGKWGSLTITERPTYSAESLDDVPKKFVKKTLDTTRIGNFYKSEGTLPKGVTRTISKSLMKKFK